MKFHSFSFLIRSNKIVWDSKQWELSKPRHKSINWCCQLSDFLAGFHDFLDAYNELI